MSRVRHVASAILTTSIATTGLVAATPTAQAADACAGLKAPIYRSINPEAGSQLLTPWASEYTLSQTKYGYSDERGVLGLGSLTKQPGTVKVQRLYNPKTADFLWVTTEAESAKAFESGYVKQNVVDFYAPTTASACTVAVHRLVKGTHSRNATSETELSQLKAGGWSDAGTSFYLRADSTSPPTSTTTTATPPAQSETDPPATTTAADTAGDQDGVFSIAVIGDTQTEVHSDSDARFANRTTWLAANKKSLDLRYVLHTGDVVNWGWVDPPQYTRAKAAMAKLTGAGIPWSVSIGNHDTRAVGWNGVAGSTGYGGAAYQNNPECPSKLGSDACKSWLLIRKTEEFNAAFPVSKLSGLGGTYEPGKADNNWTAFTAESTKWLVLTIELDPRVEVVSWAKNVVATHPNHNVIIQTHNYLTGSGTVSSSNDGYGEKSPKYIYDEIVAKYPNVKIVSSGHVGGYNSRIDTNNGNTTLSYLGNDLGNTNNPVRIVTVNTKTGSVTSTVYSKTGPTGATKHSSETQQISIIK